MQEGLSSSLPNQETNQIEKDTRSKIHEALQKFNIKQVDVARQTGIHHSTLSLWLQGKVKGHFIKIQDTLNEWLDNLYSNKPRYTTLNRSIDKQYNLRPPVMTINTPLAEEINKVQLVPISLELELEGKRQKQYIMWNLYEPYLSAEQYTRLLIDENPLYSSYQLLIVQTIKKGIQTYLSMVQAEKKLSINLKEPCLRIIQIDIQLDNINFKDRFQWDINESRNNPEQFAGDLCSELGLNAQFFVQISHQIRQQIINHRKHRVQPQQLSHLNIRNKTRAHGNQGKQKDVLDTAFSEPIVDEDNYLRTNLQEEYLWQPQVDILDANDVKRYQRLQQRKQRYSRRIR